MRTSRFGLPSRLYRAALLIAGLLHLVSVPAEAVLHGWTHVHPQVTGWTAQDTDPADPPHHHDLVCAICQAVSRALHEPASTRALADFALALPATPAASLPAPVPLSRAHARAPPV
ncbi:MAG TPA: hypothetical protein VFT45_06240 [Longimicrobium sp.]|nr:hypothetical protein [Longimicrobium sp.]